LLEFLRGARKVRGLVFAGKFTELPVRQEAKRLALAFLSHHAGGF